MHRRRERRRSGRSYVHSRCLSPSGVRIDPYYWLRDITRASTPRFSATSNAENEYTDAALAPVKGLEEKIYQEIVARIPRRMMSASPIASAGIGTSRA